MLMCDNQLIHNFLKEFAGGCNCVHKGSSAATHSGYDDSGRKTFDGFKQETSTELAAMSQPQLRQKITRREDVEFYSEGGPMNPSFPAPSQPIQEQNAADEATRDAYTALPDVEPSEQATPTDEEAEVKQAFAMLVNDIIEHDFSGSDILQKILEHTRQKSNMDLIPHSHEHSKFAVKCSLCGDLRKVSSR